MRYCTYCGDIGDTLDHVIPVSMSNVDRKRRLNCVKKSRDVVVPCCAECNSLLGNKAYYTVSTRAAFLSERFKKRYKKLLKPPDWTDEELSELGYAMRDAVEKSLKDKKEILRRIKYCETRSYLCQTIKDIWEEVDEIEGRVTYER